MAMFAVSYMSRIEYVQCGADCNMPCGDVRRCCTNLVGEHFTLTPVSSTGQALALSLGERGLSIPQIGAD